MIYFYWMTGLGFAIMASVLITIATTEDDQ